MRSGFSFFISMLFIPLLGLAQIDQAQWEIEMESHILRNAKMAKFLLQDKAFVQKFPEFKVLALDPDRAVRVLLEHDASKVIKNGTFLDYFHAKYGIDVTDIQKQAAHNYGRTLKPGDNLVQKLNLVDEAHLNAAISAENMSKAEKEAIKKLESLVDKSDRYFEAYRKASVKDPTRFPPADSKAYPQKNLPSVFSEEFNRMNSPGSKYSVDLARRLIKEGKMAEADEVLRSAKALEFVEKNLNPIEITKGLDPVSYKKIRPTFAQQADTNAFESVKMRVADRYIASTGAAEVSPSTTVKLVSATGEAGAMAAKFGSSLGKAAGGAVGIGGLITGMQYLWDPENTRLIDLAVNISGSSSTATCTTVICADFFTDCAQKVLNKKISRHDIFASSKDYSQCVGYFFSKPLQEQSKLRGDGDLNNMLNLIAPKIETLSCQQNDTHPGTEISTQVIGKDGITFEQKMSFASDDSLIKIQRKGQDTDQIFYKDDGSRPAPDILQHCQGGTSGCNSIDMKKVVEMNLYFWRSQFSLLRWAKESNRVVQTQSQAIAQCCHSRQCSDYFAEEGQRISRIRQEDPTRFRADATQ